MSTISFIYFLTKSYKAYEQVTFSCLSSTLRRIAACICLRFAVCICLRFAACICLRCGSCLRFALTDCGGRKGDPAPPRQIAVMEKRPGRRYAAGPDLWEALKFLSDRIFFSHIFFTLLCHVHGIQDAIELIFLKKPGL